MSATLKSVPATPAATKSTPVKTVKRPTAAQRSIAKREASARKVMRIVGIAGAVPVALVAIYVSYFHITKLAVEHGQSQSAAHLLPMAVDGLMLISAVAVIAQRAAKLPKFSFGAGAALTLAANALSVHHADPVAYVLAATPAVALLFSAELLLRLCLPQPTRRAPRKR